MGFAPKIRFAPDSPLEGNGFEPSVPGTKEPIFVAESELRDRTGAAKKGCLLCGTDGSNPSPSSGESGANSVRFLNGWPVISSKQVRMRMVRPRNLIVSEPIEILP